MKALHAAWYEHEPGEEITDMTLVDSLILYFHVMDALGDLMMSAEKQSLAEYTLTRIGWTLINQAREAESLVDQWHKQKQGNVTQLTADDQS